MIKLEGPWNKGFSFDVHTLNSKYIGDNQWGHPQFETTRSEMGEASRLLKYKYELTAADKILGLLDADSQFSKMISEIDLIAPIPPSNKSRPIQPVWFLANKIAQKYNKMCRLDIIQSTNCEQIKNLDTNEKYDTVYGSLTISPNVDNSLRVLLFDDVFDSGSTLIATYNKLSEVGFRNIYAFTLTKTRKSD